MKETIDFRVSRSEDCILIDVKKWVSNSSNGLTMHRMSGREVNTYIARVLSINPKKKEFQHLVKKNDLVLLTRVASEVAPYRAFATEGNDKRFYNVPIMQVIGVFEDEEISLDNLKLLTDKVLVRKVQPKYGYLITPNDNTMLGEVVKTGSFKFTKDWKKQPLQVNTGDVVLIRDNVTTEITIKGETYYAVEEAMIVGKTSKREMYDFNDFEIINSSVIMEPYHANKVLNSELVTPALEFEDLDYSDIDNRDLFKVVEVDHNLTNVNKDDIILVNRDLTNYVYFNSVKYFIISDCELIEARVEK